MIKTIASFPTALGTSWTHIRNSQLKAIPLIAVNWLEKELPNPEDQREYARERCMVALTEAVGEAMESASMNRTEIAEKLGASKGHVSTVLSGAHNMTLRTLADLLWASGFEVQDLVLAPLGVSFVPANIANEWASTRVIEAPKAATRIDVQMPQVGDYSPGRPEEVVVFDEKGELIAEQERTSQETQGNSNMALAA